MHVCSRHSGTHIARAVRVAACVCAAWGECGTSVCVCVHERGAGQEGGSPAAPAHPPRRGERRLTGSPWSLKVKLRLVS